MCGCYNKNNKTIKKGSSEHRTCLSYATYYWLRPGERLLQRFPIISLYLYCFRTSFRFHIRLISFDPEKKWHRSGLYIEKKKRQRQNIRRWPWPARHQNGQLICLVMYFFLFFYPFIFVLCCKIAKHLIFIMHLRSLAKCQLNLRNKTGSLPMADRAAKFVFFFLHRMVCANKHRMGVIYIMNESFKRLQLCPLFSAAPIRTVRFCKMRVQWRVRNGFNSPRVAHIQLSKLVFRLAVTSC